jgi:hypothetical protein
MAMSQAAAQVMARMVTSANRPTVLHDAFRNGHLSAADLPELIAFAWLYDDSPTSQLPESDWLSMFRAAGFFCEPSNLMEAPTRSVRLYRVSTEDRSRRMSWTDDEECAPTFGTRHQRHGQAKLYQATVQPEHVLACLRRSDEGLTVVVDPTDLNPE